METTRALAFVAVLAAATFSALAEAPTVVDVRVEGNSRITDEQVLSHVRTGRGEPYDEAIVKADQRRLLETGEYENVVVRRVEAAGGVAVVFQVEERPIVETIQLFGNNAFPDEDLMPLIPLRAGGPLDLAAVQAGREALLGHYAEEGFHDTRVDYDRGKAFRSGEVVYQIREGVTTRVTDIRFEGNDFFTSIWLKQRIDSMEAFWPFVPGRLDRAQVDGDVGTLRQMYVQEGFLAAQVGAEIEFSEDREEAVITFRIDEGPRFRVGEVRFEGNELFADEELAERIELTPGAYFTPLKFRRDTERLEDTYGELGYIETRVTERKVFTEQEGVVDLVFAFRESGQYEVGDIIVRGNSVTRESVIRRQLTFFPRQRFDSTAMDRSRRRLLDTQLFDEVEIRPVGAGPDTRDAVVEVTEGRTGNFMIGAAVSTDDGLVGTITLVERNFDLFEGPKSFAEMFDPEAWRGGGQTLRITAEPGTELMRFNLQWREPMMFDRPYSLSAQAFLYDRARENYDERRYGGQFGIGHMFENRWYGSITPRVEGVELSDVDVTSPVEVRLLEGRHTIIGLAGSLVRDRTDSRIHPTRGGRFSISYEQVMGDFDYGRAETGYRHYWTVHTDALDRPHVLKGRVSVGHIVGDAPVFDRYFGGGSAWLRGFEYRGVSPRSGPANEPIGGDFRLFAGCEYEFPLVAEQLKGVLFLDTGTISEDFSVDTYRASVGFGLRWTIPGMGPIPIKLDFGFPVSKDENDETEVFNFSIGWWF